MIATGAELGIRSVRMPADGTVHPALSTEKAGLPAFNPHKGSLTSFGAHATSRTRHESPLGTVEHDSITRTTSSTLPIFAFSTRYL